MWLLIMTFLNFAHPDVVLERYATERACQVARNQVGFDMAEAYPQTHDFNIVCRFKPKVI